MISMCPGEATTVLPKAHGSQSSQSSGMPWGNTPRSLTGQAHAARADAKCSREVLSQQGRRSLHEAFPVGSLHSARPWPLPVCCSIRLQNMPGTPRAARMSPGHHSWKQNETRQRGIVGETSHGCIPREKLRCRHAIVDGVDEGV